MKGDSKIRIAVDMSNWELAQECGYAPSSFLIL